MKVFIRHKYVYRAASMLTYDVRACERLSVKCIDVALSGIRCLSLLSASTSPLNDDDSTARRSARDEHYTPLPRAAAQAPVAAAAAATATIGLLQYGRSVVSTIKSSPISNA